MTVIKPWDMILVFFYLFFFALAATYDWVSGNCTNISLSWGLTYFANDDIILSMPRTDDLELVLRYWNFVSYSVCFLCSKLKVNRGATDIWGQCVEYYIIWSPSYYWYFVYLGYMPCTGHWFCVLIYADCLRLRLWVLYVGPNSSRTVNTCACHHVLFSARDLIFFFLLLFWDIITTLC